MSAFMRYAGLAAMAGLISLVGCGTTTAGSPGAAHSPSSASTAPQATTPAPSTATPKPTETPTLRPSTQPGGPTPVYPRAGSYLTAIRTGQHDGYDRVVFQFSGKLPGYAVERVNAVYHDPKGDQVPLAGQSYLRVVFRGAVCQQPLHHTCTVPTVLTPYYPELLTVSAAGEFEGVLSFGVGLAAQGGYHVFTAADPARLVIDVSHVALGAFPGIWNITSWPRYWTMQYSWLNGHQPWLSNPSMVIEAWARSEFGTTPVISQVSANRFKATEPDGTVHIVIGVRPVSVPGPWVIAMAS
jgi:hypothetical protein